ncbi:Imm1 family immunity protein [Streptomyces sp. NPDC058745]|uniref:Imm1 family immunity protein n=1 Tax=Streptomyces sp. NPDC058745 TaxID=3346621 RepID=UPI0036AD042B
MILSVCFGGQWHYAEAPEEKSRLVSEVMATLKGESGSGQSWSPGQDAWFSLAEERHNDENRVADNHLRVAINRSTGFGALIWFVNDDSPRKGGIYDQVWVSDNPEPSGTDPRVVSDPGYPLFHDPSSAIPLARLRAALEEFSDTGTGDRPECIAWVPGHMNGQRFDRPSMVETVEITDPFA